MTNVVKVKIEDNLKDSLVVSKGCMCEVDAWNDRDKEVMTIH